MNNNEFLELRKKIIEIDFKKMNENQKEAVLTVDGPLLVLAGAGSGKTTVLVNRIANILKYGNAYFSDEILSDVTDETVEEMKKAIERGEVNDELAKKIAVHPAKPWQILSITFTNKAAGEMKSRLELMLGESALDIKAGTFHSICAKMLRRNGDRLGYTNSFTIYDTADSKRLVTDCMKELNISEKQFQPRMILASISKAKNNMNTPEQLMSTEINDYYLKNVARIYNLYQDKIKKSNAMDFDDLLLNTILLFRQNEDVLNYYQKLFKYILIDEYQDTNMVQYELVRLLSEKSGNLCVVGDDDQSIYKFRGATIENILSFEKTFSNAKVIRLEENYRSTQTILDAANKVISNNKERKGKTLWTRNGTGEKITYFHASDEKNEARFVTEQIQKNVIDYGNKYSENAVLYRMNAQSNAIENYFVRASVPYRIIGGHKFYDRAEIKDIVSYLKVIINPDDIISLKRIINTPKRGIGDSTVEKIEKISYASGEKIFDIVKTADEYAELSRASSRLIDFSKKMEELQELAETELPSKIFNELLSKSEYILYLDSMGDEGITKRENVLELLSNISKYEEENENPTIYGFLEEVSLLSDIDNYDADADAVILMTIHSAKGLEFENVFLIGMEEGIFPSNRSIFEGESEIEEERRTAYVALTRAKKNLYISNARQRFLMGQTNFYAPSRFFSEIPESLINALYNPEIRKEKTSVPEYRRPAYQARATVGKAPQSSGSTETFDIGQRLRHPMFGEGILVKATAMGNDTLLEIIFDSVGTKKVMQNYVKLTKI